MFRELRRKKQLLSNDECSKLLENASSGVLAVLGDNDYPYTVPLSFVYSNNKIYFHCAKSGHKIDSIRKNDKVSFCIIDKDEMKPEKFTTYFRSVVVFGKAKIIMDEKNKKSTLELLAEKYSPRRGEATQEEIKSQIENMFMIEIDIEHMSGKQAIELI